MPIKRLLIFVFIVLQYYSLSAQGFCVEGVFSTPQRGVAQLTVHGDDNQTQELRSKIRDGRCVFEGTVSHPVVAELWHRSMSKPLTFYLENSNIRIAIDAQTPERSRVSGSRSNSEYRLLAEQWDEEPDYASPYAPLVLLQRESSTSLLSDFDRLQGEACKAYHYRELQQRVDRIRAVQIGAKLPHFEFSDTAHRRVATDTLLCDTTYNVILFGASFCGQCEQVRRQLQRLSEGEMRLNIVVCRIDDDPRGWDADWVDLLAIDHIPYLLLVASDGTIVERDLRVWEIEKNLKTSHLAN